MEKNVISKIPFETDYVLNLGETVYKFSYYEWIIIYIVEILNPGFVKDYSRAKSPMTSGAVKNKFEQAIESTDFTEFAVAKHEMMQCFGEFKQLVEKRNALIHAHPISYKTGAQILAYQGNLSKVISDYTWTNENITALNQEIESASERVSEIFEKLKG